MKSDTKKYYIHVLNDDNSDNFIFCPSAEPLKIPDFEEFDFFIHKSYILSPLLNNPGKRAWSKYTFSVSEATTGKSLAGNLTYDAAILQAIVTLVSNKEAFFKAVRENTERSPYPN